jgi:hypothetical protein
MTVEALDHYVGGLDESGRTVAPFQLKFAYGFSGNDRRDLSVFQGEHDLGKQA